MTISRKEVIKIAEISRLALDENEIDSIVKQLSDVLHYAERVQYIAQNVDTADIDKNRNVMRDGLVVQSDSRAILLSAPEREDNFFVVPRIIDSK